MTVRDINTIIETLCPNDEDYEKPCISPKYLRQELEQLALEQEHRHLEQEPTTKNDCAEQNGCITCSLDDGDDCCRKLYEESMQEPTTKNCESCRYYGLHHEVCNYCYKCSLWTEQEPTTKNDCAEQNGCTFCSLENGEDCCRKLYEESMQEPTTKNDLGVDCISRKAVIDELKRYFHDEYYQRTDIQDCRDCFIEDVLNHLPSLTPQEPKTGHWITKPHVYGVTYCSECDFELRIDNTNYCPNCGAKMAESEADNGND